MTNNRTAPRGFEIEFDLGLVHSFSQPGTRRLVGDAPAEGIVQKFFTTSMEGELHDDYRALGYIEEAPLPMLDLLELRYDPQNQVQVLVSGSDDPLYAKTTPVSVIGYVESYPIQPRHPPGQAIDWSLAALLREDIPAHTCHRYFTDKQTAPGLVSLGGVYTRPGPRLVALHRDAAGLLSSELLTVTRQKRVSPVAKLRWMAAPLSWPEGIPRAWAARASASRARTILFQRPERGVTDDQLLGYLRSEPAPGWSPLFSAQHPALADQYVTRSELEATDMGYKIDGVLGYAMDRFAARSREALPEEVPWASRFGQRRRYVEGATPD